jgi:hypothetical protein
MTCLDAWNPRKFSEVLATIILAEEQNPICGQHTVTFAALQAVNRRWATYEEAGRACLAHTSLAKLNAALSITTGGLRVDAMAKNGDITVSYAHASNATQSRFPSWLPALETAGGIPDNYWIVPAGEQFAQPIIARTVRREGMEQHASLLAAAPDLANAGADLTAALAGPLALTLEAEHPAAYNAFVALQAALATARHTEAQPAAQPPEMEPAVSEAVDVTATITLSLWPSQLQRDRNGIGGLATAAAIEAERSFGSIDGPEGWREYRRSRDGGPLAADLAELLSGLICDAMPGGGFEITDISVHHQPQPAPGE